jgi:endonuclease/exonuclease/phosphatase family metal-dependent hydrolase
MDVTADDVIGGITEGTKPQVGSRAKEIGRYVQQNADIASLCEVWTDSEKSKVLNQWSTKPEHVHRITKRLDRDSAGGFFRREEKSKGSSGLLTISPNLDIVSEQFEEYQNESGFFETRADKGILLAEIDVGMGSSRLSIYSTHLQAGDRPTALKQVVQLAKFILDTKAEKNPALVVGDFNIDEYDVTQYATEKLLDVGYKVPDIVQRAVLEKVEDGIPTGIPVTKKKAYQVLTDILGVLGFRDLWTARNGTPGYTSNMKKSGFADQICPPDPQNDRFCNDEIEDDISVDGKTPARIDYIFVSNPSPRQSFTMDFTRPRRLRLERESDAPGKDEIAFLSDHIGLMTTILLAPA